MVGLKDDPWRVVDCLSATATIASGRPAYQLDPNSYVTGGHFLLEFGRQRANGCRLIYSPEHSHLFCFYNQLNQSASFWVGPWYRKGQIYTASDPKYIGDLLDKAQDISEIRRLLEPGELITIIDAEGVKKDIQAFPPEDLRLDASKWTGRIEKRRARKRHSIKRYAQIEFRDYKNFRLPTVWINKNFKRHFIVAKYTISLTSIFGFSFILSQSLSILSGLMVFAFLDLLERLQFFKLTELTYPSPNLSRFAPKGDAKTTGVLDYNHLKNKGALGRNYPDNICVLNFTNENEMDEIHRWLLELSEGQLDDKGKGIRLSVVIADDLTKYFVILMPVRNSWKKEKEGSKGLNLNSDGPQDKYSQTYEIATDWSDKFDVPFENVEFIRRFLKSSNNDGRCALAIGQTDGKVLADVFIIHDFHLIMLPELSSKSHEYSLLKSLGHIP